MKDVKTDKSLAVETQVNARDSQHEQLIEREITHELFMLVKKDGNVWIAMKDQIIHDQPFKTFEDAKAYIETKPYKLVCIASFIYGQHVSAMLHNQQKNNN